MSKQKKIGIIGGLGPQATKFLYELLINISQTKYQAANNDDYPAMVIESVPVPDFISSADNIDKAKQMLIASTQSLTRAGASILAIGCNTVHLLLDDLQAQTDVDFVSMPDLVAEKCKADGYQKVGLLGSSMTLDSKLYDQKLEKNHIKVIKPNQEDRKIVDNIIRSVLAGNKSHTDEQKYLDVIESLFVNGAETIILGCTELPLAVDYQDKEIKVINSLEVLATALVDYYYN